MSSADDRLRRILIIKNYYRVLLRSYYFTTLNLDLSAILDPSFSVPTATEEERRLNLLERVAPTKPFITWWRSVQTERSPLKDYDRVFDW